jgi:hypothetical protein
MKKYIEILVILVLFTGCRRNYAVDGNDIQRQVLATNDLSDDTNSNQELRQILAQINCMISTIYKKRLVLADEYSSGDTTQILVIPFDSNRKQLRSDAFSDIANRLIVVNPSYIKEFTIKNTLGDSSSYRPVIELMLLHEIGHFRLGKEGAFDRIADSSAGIGQQLSNSQPEYITTIKKIEMSADSLAIDMVKRTLKPTNKLCLEIAFDVERVVPGMQFQLSGRRIIDGFGRTDVNYLHDPSTDHPNLELRVTFMNYFLYPSDSLRNMINDYLYNRTVVPIHRQEFDPEINQDQEKILK